MFPAFKKNTNSRTVINHNFTDDELVAEYFSEGNLGIIGELYKRYTHLVLGVCLKYLKNEEKSKDAVMEIFESLIDKLKVHKVTNFKSWLYTVSKNHCLMLLRSDSSYTKLKDRIFHNSILENMELQDQMHPLIENEKELLIEQLDKALNELNIEQGNCIKLMYLENKSYREIADITGYSMKEVKSYIQNGKRNLKNYLISLNDKKE
ncbi:MAG: sigma-70 family RNA polymerase sigma factor [Bacteroidales bacterium]|nr:MAG: sigma-70 family RNA polymerase sigma factor [Bacteroidales bacterium]